MNFDLDIAIVIAFLLLTIFVGMGHGKKVKTLEDYALGQRNFTTAALIATIVATYASGSGFITTLNRTYNDGAQYILASIGIGFSLWILAFFLVPRMTEFLGKVSIASAMGDLYGQKVRVITAATATFGAVGSIAVQFKVLGSVISYFWQIPASITIIVAGMIATIYSAFGGIRAVTFTDVLQFFAFGIILPLLSFVIWNDFYEGGYSVVTALSEPRYDLSLILSADNPQLFSIIILFLYFAMPLMAGSDFQRISMGKDTAQVKKAFFISGFLLMAMKISIAWIPFLIHVMNPNIEANQLMPYIIDHYGYSGLKGLIMVAIIAFAMSTADSKVNSASVMLTNDICKVFARKSLREILVSRLFAFALGIGGIILALKGKDLLGIILFANSFYVPVVTQYSYWLFLAFVLVQMLLWFQCLLL
ncbi:MAG: sodium:solute symporter family protein [Rickettsiaceae bacterium]|nr:sodium:solute symporter family protein [Rickettsiaceae bacterium]